MRVTRQKAKFLEEIALREEALNIDTTKGQVLPDDIVMYITEFLDKPTVVRLRSASRAFLRAATTRRKAEVYIRPYRKKALAHKRRLQQLCLAENAILIRSLELKVESGDHQGAECMKLLTLAQNLRRLAIEVAWLARDYFHGMVNPGLWTGCFKQLTYLTLNCSSKEFSQLRLQEIEAPRLLEFHLTARPDIFTFPGGEASEIAIQSVLVPFLNAHSGTLQDVRLDFTMSRAQNTGAFFKCLRQFPHLRILCFASVWTQRNDPGVVQTPFHDFLGSHILQLHELLITQHGQQEPVSPTLDSIFQSIPISPTPLTSLKLGTKLDPPTQFLAWIATTLHQFRTLWIPGAPVSLAFLEQVDRDAGQNMQDLMLNVENVTDESILRLSCVFPNVKELRLRFVTVMEGEPPNYYPELPDVKKEHAIAQSARMNRLQVFKYCTMMLFREYLTAAVPTAPRIERKVTITVYHVGGLESSYCTNCGSGRSCLWPPNFRQ